MGNEEIKRRKQKCLLIVTVLGVFLCNPFSFLIAADVITIQYVFNIAKIVLFLLSLIYLVYTKIFNKMTLVVFGYVSIYMLGTIINNGNTYSAFNVSIGILGTYIWTEYFICKMPNLFLKIFLKYMTMMIIVNLISIILFPNGLLINGNNSYAVRLLGIDNSLASILYPTLIISYVQFCRGKIKLQKVKFLLIIVLMTELLIFSATSIIGLIPIFWGFYAICLEKNTIKLSLVKIVILYLLIFYFINFSLSNSNITNFIADVFHKSLNFSGRTYIWGRSIEIISGKNLWIGYGAYNKELLRTIYFIPANCHSFLYELIIGVGIIGTLLFFYMFFKAYKKTSQLNGNNNSLINCLLCYYAVILTMGLAESTSLYLANFMILAIFYHCDKLVEVENS